MTLFARVPEEQGEHSAENIVIHSEGQQQLWTAVGRLSHKQREVVTLHYYGGLSLPEAASILGIPLGTCKSRLHAALQKMRLSNELELELFELKEVTK
ncbi:hypothetical protein PMSD_09820 [Paenibacillus macquariensis subsp. defensor]|nr:hypothetical protein PMSD_09820 [Paenibacillus macquariensis subsp. defensor]